MTLTEFRDFINERIAQGLGECEVVRGNVDFLVPWMGQMGTTAVIEIPHPTASVKAYRVPINSKYKPEAERIKVIVL